MAHCQQSTVQRMQRAHIPTPLLLLPISRPTNTHLAAAAAGAGQTSLWTQLQAIGYS